MLPIKPERGVRRGYAAQLAARANGTRTVRPWAGFSWDRRTRRIVEVLVALVLTWPNGSANIKGGLAGRGRTWRHDETG